MTSDIIAEYCFGFGENYIEAPGFNAVVVEVTDALTNNMHITLQAQVCKLPEYLYPCSHFPSFDVLFE
jgi:hypothetical protein